MLTTKIPHTFSRNGYYYFSRRVPSDLLHHYNYHRIVQSLRTRRNGVAKSRSTLLASQLDSFWAQLRLANADIPGKSMLSNTNDLSKTTIDSTESISIEAALKIYLKQKNAGKGKTFKAAAERACRYLSDVAGSKNLHEYSRSDALTFRNALIERGLAGSSVARIFNTVSAIFNFTSNELALELRNPFRGVYFDKVAGVSKRLPIPTSTIRTIQKSCKEGHRCSTSTHETISSSIEPSLLLSGANY